MTDERRKQLEDHRASLANTGAKSGEAFDRTIYALSGATIAFTATYIKAVSTSSSPNCWLYLCWILATVAIISIAISQYLNQVAHRAGIDAIDAELECKPDLQKAKEKKQDWCQAWVERFLNPMALFCSVAAIMSFVLFIML